MHWDLRHSICGGSAATSSAQGPLEDLGSPSGLWSLYGQDLKVPIVVDASGLPGKERQPWPPVPDPEAVQLPQNVDAVVERLL